MAKTDVKKDLKHLYAPSTKEVVLVDVPAMNFLMVDGAGDPNESQSYQEAMMALYSVAFTLKFTLKKRGVGVDYVVPPLEGLWWTHGMANFDMQHKAAWLWTSMIMQLEHITADMVQETIAEVRVKGNPPALDLIRFESFHEGLSAQIMHIGPYAAEAPTIEKLHQHIRDHGFQPRGKHHEIYLSDPRRTAPQKLKTVIRQPVTRGG